jgi:hypothetical protein
MSQNVTKEGVEVKPGQVWRDLDKRMGNRNAKVIEVVAGKAKMEMCRSDGSTYGGSTTRVSVSRMHKSSTGWALAEGTSNTEKASEGSGHGNG